jgi:hypothetical protein
VAELVNVIAALFVDPRGVYANLEDVEAWDEERDARLYDGPWPVVAHPPCARWSRFAGFTEARFGLMRGDDGGCFASALDSVRRFGGVLEHPAHSDAFAIFGLPEPTVHYGWTAGICGGWSAYVEQGRYGHPVKKATWLYAYGVELADLRWGYTRDSEGRQPNGEWGGMDAWRDQSGKHAWERALQGEFLGYAGKAIRSVTPPEFRDVLLDMARTATRERAAA